MKTWVQLGRCGDLLSLLPLMWKDAQDGNRRTVMVADEYVSLFDGVSYVDTISYHGPHYEIAKACEQASKNGEWFSSQVNGPLEQVVQFVYRPAGQATARTTSFEKEMWKVAGRLKEWDQCYPLVFDRRNTERETALLAEHGFLRPGKQKRLMLVSLHGNSSPFPHRELLMELLRGRFGKTHRIMELPQAERFFDLLALYERADVLVTTDSAPLHLAWACPKLPVVALVNDKPMLWNGSAWRPNHIFYCRYGDFPERAVEMLNTIDNRPQQHEVVHIWNDYDRVDSESFWSTLPISKGICGRDSQSINDPKRVPYLKDCLRMAMQKECKWVVVTHPNAVVTNPDEVIEHEACFAYRIAVKEGEEVFQPTVDLFCATKEWWKSHFDEIPDYLLGKDYWWTHGLRALFTKHGATDITGATFKPVSKQVEHIEPPFPPRIIHNKDLTERYIEENRVCCRYPKVADQVEVVASFSGMLRYGYNPAIVESEGRIMMALRYHPVDSPITSLMLATLRDDFTTESTQPLEISGNSIEDPKFFMWNGKLRMSWVDADVRTRPFKSVVRWATYSYETLMDFKTPELPGNDYSGMQKNYVFFEYEGILFCIYNCQPYEIYRMDDLRLVSSQEPKWAYGAIRGGTSPVPYNGKWLRFFHGHLDNEFGYFSRRYYMGAMIIEPKPPFEVIAVSKKPIIYGSEIDQLRVKDRPKYWKANVVFPNGVVGRDGHWLVSVGVNDSASMIVKILPKELNL